MRELEGPILAIVRQVDHRAETRERMEQISARLHRLKIQRGKYRNLLWPATCKAASGGAAAENYEKELIILEKMAAEKDMSFESWKRHGGDTDSSFSDEKDSWNFFTWRFGTHMEERNRLQECITEIDVAMAELRAEYGYLLAKVKNRA